jgi:hypothetical protein
MGWQGISMGCRGLRVALRSIIATIFLLVVACSLVPLATSQLVADAPKSSADAKPPEPFREDWSTPSIKTSQMLSTTIQGPMLDDTHADYMVELWRLTWRPSDPIEVYVIRPRAVKKPPVILNLFSYPNDLNPYKIEAVQKDFVKDGFAVVGFTSALTGQRYHDVAASFWFLSQLPECLAATAHDVQLVIDYLEKRGDLDTSRIGMFGNGSSGAIAILASAADPRIKALDVLDPWGDWPNWLATSTFVPPAERASYVKPAFLKSVAPLETLDWLPKIQAKKFRLQQPAFNSEDPGPVKEKIRSAAPAGTVFVQYKSMDEVKAAFPHSSNLDWLKHELSALPDPAKTEKASVDKHSQ